MFGCWMLELWCLCPRWQMDNAGYELERLHTDVMSLCSRIELLPCSTARDRLAQSGNSTTASCSSSSTSDDTLTSRNNNSSWIHSHICPDWLTSDLRLMSVWDYVELCPQLIWWLFENRPEVDHLKKVPQREAAVSEVMKCEFIDEKEIWRRVFTLRRFCRSSEIFEDRKSFSWLNRVHSLEGTQKKSWCWDFLPHSDGRKSSFVCRS